jgi:NAD(P)-dependent dehydrogenase (short-subunit alcohol dehydrogenase family)
VIRGQDGLVAVVTGGARGIGQTLARRLGALNAAVAIVDIRDGDETAELIRGDGGTAIALKADTSTEAGANNAAERVSEAFGVANVLVNNAGIYPPKPFLDLTVADWDHVIGVNLRSCFLMARALLPGMRDAGWGRIVSVASTSYFNPPPLGMVHYISSKGAVLGLTRGLAAEVGDWGVTVNAIAVGGVVTPGTQEAGFAELFPQFAQMQNVKRVGTGEDVAGALAYLVSDGASFMTGQTLVVDGGYAHV